MRSSVFMFLLLCLALCTACADKQPPRFQGDAALSVDQASPSSLRIRWPAAHDDRQLHSYRVYRDDERVAELTGDETTFTLDELEPSTDYLLAVAPVDEAGNMGERLSLVASTSDGEPPTFGAGARLRIRDVTPVDVAGTGRVDLELSWTEATDESEIARYNITQEGQIVATVPGDQLSYRLEGAPGQDRDYAYGVSAEDAAGNRSAALASRFPALELDQAPAADVAELEPTEPVTNVAVLTDQPALRLNSGLNGALRPTALERIRLLGSPIISPQLLGHSNMEEDPGTP